jgi:hypothetical protein
MHMLTNGNSDEYCEHKNGYWSKNETTIEQTIHSLNCVVV